MPTSSKNRIFIALILLAALIIGGFLLSKDKPSDSSRDKDNDIAETKGDEVTVSGIIACLPYRINISGQECVKSIKGDDGKVYALNSPKGLENAMNDGTKVTAIGVFQPADTSVDDSSAFVYDGVLVVRTLQRQ